MSARGLGGRLQRGALALGAALAAAMTACAPAASAADRKVAQQDFATAEEAVDALIAAVRADDQAALLRVLGPGGEKLIHSGDKVADKAGRERLISAYDQAHRIAVERPGVATLVVGTEKWSLPIPVVRQAERWHFDTVTSAQKIIDRRVGRNELNVIEVCRAYVEAQREYAGKDRLGEGRKEYAQRFDSHPGRHDGLYWEAAASEEQSPFGPLVAKAQAEGYDSDDKGFRPEPYHGYFFRILTRQGPHAPGGARDYVVDGRMTGGFALIAFPARWGDSGIVTFVVNQDGIVFQKNLGPDTKKLAREISEYDPDPSWTTP